MSVAISALSLVLPDNFIQGSMSVDTTVGTGTRRANHKVLALPKVQFTLWPGSGSQVGLINVLADTGKAMTNGTPGTTDVLDVDIQALTDLAGQAKVGEEAVFLAVLNFATADGANIHVMPHGTNGWTAPFLDMGTPGDGKLRIPPGFVNPAGVAIPGGLILWGGNLASMPVSSTNKVLSIKLSSGVAAAEVRAIIGARTADS